MYIIDSYPIAVIMCIITMICWGSWANTQKLASKKWAYSLFYWDYSLGVIILALIFGLTLGSIGENGQSFFANLSSASFGALGSAFVGGVVFNIANLLLVAAIALTGMAIAFPVGIGLALVIGVVVNYIATPLGNPLYIFIGVALVSLAIVLDAFAYRKISKAGGTAKGLLIALAAGILMGFFFRFVAASISEDLANPTAGMLTPYAALFVFSIGIFVSNFVFNTFFMYKPVEGEKATYRDYFKKGTPRLHLTGIAGGMIWSLGMAFSLIASGKAGYAISYGLGQGATLIAAIWGVFIWKEFKDAPKGTNPLLSWMFLSFVVGLGLIIYARYA